MRFLGLQFLDILNFLGGARTLDNFLKAYGASEVKGFFPYEWFDRGEKLNVIKLSTIESCLSKLKKHNVLRVEYDKLMQMKNSGTQEGACLNKMRLKKNPRSAEAH